MELIVFIARFVPLRTNSDKVDVLDYSRVIKFAADLKFFVAAYECFFRFWLVF